MKEIPAANSQEEALIMFQMAYALDPEDKNARIKLELLEKETRLDNQRERFEEEVRRMETLYKWLREGGAKFNKIEMRYYAPKVVIGGRFTPEYSGMHTNQDVKG